MTQTCETCETCRYWDDRTCWGEPRACTREARRPACSLYRARGDDQDPRERPVKYKVTEPCGHEPKGMPRGGFDDVTNTCSKCGKRIMRDLGPWREEPSGDGLDGSSNAFYWKPGHEPGEKP